jgi:hypothetical protein
MISQAARSPSTKARIQRVFTAVTLLTLMTAAGCNLPGGDSPTPLLQEASASGVQATRTGADDDTIQATGSIEIPYHEPDELPADFEALLDRNIEAGIWTREEGLLTLTRYLAGTLDPQQASTIEQVAFNEATGLLGQVRAYLDELEDDATRAELLRLLQALSPDSASLDAYSVAADQALSRSPGMASRISLVNCQSLATDGFPKEKAIACYQYQSFTHDAKTYRLYYPLEWGSQGGAQKPWVDAAYDAAQTAVKHYAKYGTQDSINLVFTLLDLPKKKGAITWADAAAPGSGKPCTVGIYPEALGQPTEAFKQIIAHEVFHCFQYTRFSAQKVNLKASDWWVEGSAEFFSNLVYPSIDLEHRWLANFNSYSRYKPLVEMSYESYLFFQYLDDRPDHDVATILGLIGLLPASGGAAEQISALSGYTKIDQIWHDFGRAFVDGTIIDTNTKAIKTDVQYNSKHLIKDTAALDLEVKDFSISRYRLSLGPGQGYHLALAKTDAEVLQAMQDMTAPTQWLPVLVDRQTGCADYIALFTATGTILANPRQVEIQAIVDQPAAAAVTCDTCLVGTWDLDQESFAQYLSAPFKNADPGLFGIDSMGGTWRLHFSQQSIVTGEYDYYVAYELNQTGGGSGFGVLAQVLVDITGNGTAQYDIDGVEHIVFTLQQDNVKLEQKILINGQELPTAGDLMAGMGPSLSSGITGQAEYTCDDIAGTLALSYDLGGSLSEPVKYNRASTSP